MGKTIVFVHGAWLTPLCWEKFAAYFRKKGFKCIAPAWPYHDAPIEKLRSAPAKGLSNLGITEIVDHYDKIIRGMEEPPILIGHSFGGLFVQMLLDRGLGSAGIAISSAPPKGILPLYFSVIKSISSMVAVTPFGGRTVQALPFKDFQYAFAHTLPLKEQRAIYEKYMVPETRRIFFEALASLFTDTAAVGFGNGKRSPLLLIAGGLDRICPAPQVLKNYGKYANSRAKTDYKEFGDRAHWITEGDGCEEIAEYIFEWLKGQAAAKPKRGQKHARHHEDLEKRGRSQG